MGGTIEILKNSAYKEKDSDFFKDGGWEMVGLEIPQAIENLLKAYKEKEVEKKWHMEIISQLSFKLGKYQEELEKRDKEYEQLYKEHAELIISYEKLEREIEHLKLINSELNGIADVCIKLQKEIRFKDKVIEEMAKYLAENDVTETFCVMGENEKYIDCEFIDRKCEDCIKEYFRKKVKDNEN